QIGSPDQRLQASAVTARADRPGLVDRKVTNLTCRTAEPSVDASVDHQACAQAGGGLDVRKARRASACPEVKLPPRAEVRVVVDEDRRVEPVGQLAYGVDRSPATQDGPGAHRTSRGR